MALAGQLDRRDYRVFILTGDGELDEGQVWEAAMAAAKYATGRLTALVDRNGYQQTGAVDEVLPTDPLPAKFEAMGWAVRTLDGHDWAAVLAALDAAVAPRDRPMALIARTVKGFGVEQIVTDAGNKFHGVPLKADEAERALAAIEAA
jgi:transketolase